MTRVPASHLYWRAGSWHGDIPVKPWILGNHPGQTGGVGLLLEFLAVGVTTEIQINRQLNQYLVVQSKAGNKKKLKNHPPKNPTQTKKQRKE